jgi:hypothetical protein
LKGASLVLVHFARHPANNVSENFDSFHQCPVTIGTFIVPRFLKLYVYLSNQIVNASALLIGRD